MNPILQQCENMPRVRKNKSHYWLPPRVYLGKSAYELHPKGGGSITLCDLNSDQASVWLAYSRVIKKLPVNTTVAELKALYFKSARYLQTAPKTQKSYCECWRAIEPVFGQMDCKEVLPKHIRLYMDERGAKAKISANRERALLNNIFGHALEYGLIESNPCTGVRMFKERGREQFYIEDDEYYGFWEDSDPIIKIFMELSYLLGARGQDIRNIRLGDLREDGIYISQKKTGKRQVKRWNDRLKAVVKLAKELRNSRVDPLRDSRDFLIVTTQGEPYSEHGLKSIWQRNRDRVMKKRIARANGKPVPPITWTFHDIKAKSISDYQGDKQLFSGHKSRAMMERYNRTPDVMDALDNEFEMNDTRRLLSKMAVGEDIDKDF